MKAGQRKEQEERRRRQKKYEYSQQPVKNNRVGSAPPMQMPVHSIPRQYAPAPQVPTSRYATVPAQPQSRAPRQRPAPVPVMAPAAAPVPAAVGPTHNPLSALSLIHI